MFVPNVKILIKGVPDKSLTKILEKKKNGQIGDDKHEDADSVLHDTSIVISSVCTEFQNPRRSSPEKPFTQISLCIMLE